MTYVNLHTHSTYSILDGHGQPKNYAQKAASLGMPALAVTDHGNVFGWMDFYDACKEEGVKPLLGIEAYQARKTRFDRDDEERAGKAIDELEQRGPYHVTLIARNNTGYHNLIKLTSQTYLDGFFGKPRLDWDLLSQYAEGITVLSGCLNGALQQALLRDDFDYALQSAARYQEIVGKDHFFVELQDHRIPEQDYVRSNTIEIAKRIGAPIVPSCDCHYVHKEDSESHDVLLCISTGARQHEEDRFKFKPEEFYLKSYEEMCERFPKEWLKNTLIVADQVDLNLEFGELHFPEFPIPNDEPVDEYLERHVWKGARQRYGDPIPQEVVERLEYELYVIKQMGFQHYFLVVSDLVQWAKDEGIRVGPGRGSGAGSCVSYCMFITNLDPLRYGLLFERFLVEGRVSPPDLDLDFDDRYRDRVIDYVRREYGDDRVAHICTFGTIKAKKAIRDAARVLDYEYIVGDKLAKLMPLPAQGFTKSIDEALESEDIRKIYETDKDAKIIFDAARGIEGVVRETGIHAAGVVIGKTKITDYVPVMQRPDPRGNKGLTTTQWDMHRVDQCGLLKVDFLGLRNLSVIDMCIDHIEERHGFRLDIDSISIDDNATFESIRQGKTQGIFQLESGGMKNMAVAMQPNCIEDIMAIIALFRPGPLGSGMDKLYISRKHGRSQADVDHPLLEEILSDSYGVILYQEHVLAIARKLAGFSAGRADDLRKVVGKKYKDQIPLFREEFVQGCRENGVDNHIANKLFDTIEHHGRYSFNRAHSAAYARICYETAYLKIHYPTEYMAGLLSSVDTKERLAPYLNECRNMGIEVLPPSINYSRADFKVESDTSILFGLASIDGIGPSIVENIVGSKSDIEYYSIYDFMRRVNPEVLKKNILEHLIGSGALDELVPQQTSRSIKGDDRARLLDIERNELGLYITEHPLLEVWDQLEDKITYNIEELADLDEDTEVLIAGLLTKVEPKITRRGAKMWILELEDLTGSVEIVVFPKEASYNSFVEGEMVVVKARVDHEGDEEHHLVKMLFKDVERPQIIRHGAEPIVLRLNRPLDQSIVKEIQEEIERFPGNSPVYLECLTDDHVLSFQADAEVDADIKDRLLTIIGNNNEL